MNRIAVVLHNPIYPRNVGMCARAMANMGVERLIVIGPQCDLTHEEAKQGAAHAQEILRNVSVYPTQKEFLEKEGAGIRVALSGRDGRLKRPDDLGTVLHKIMKDPEHPVQDPRSRIYLFFGPEDDGLANEDMELCNHICRLPTWGEITSLNLSHAVLLTLYMVRSNLEALNPSEPTTEPEMSSDAGESEPAYYPSQTIKRWLEALGFDLNARRVSIEKTLNRILLSRSPTHEELRIIDTVLQQTVRRLKGEKQD